MLCARRRHGGTLDDTIARMQAYREAAGVDWVQFESPHSVDEISSARRRSTDRSRSCSGKLGRYLDLDEHLALGVTIAWYPGFSHAVTWAALWDFMTDFQARGTRAWDDFVDSRRGSPLPDPRDAARGRRRRQAAGARTALSSARTSTSGSEVMARDGYRIFDSDTHVGPDAAILSNYLSAAEKDRLAGWERYRIARPPRPRHLHKGPAPLSPPARRRRAG